MNQVDINDGTPLYQQVAEQLMLYIHEHSLNPGQRLPSEKELSDTYGVSRITVRKALELLSSDNIVVKQQGKGTFVASMMPMQRNMKEGLSSFTEICRSSGIEPSTKVLGLEIVDLPARVAASLELPNNSKGIVMKRIRYADNVPVMIETNYFPVKSSFLFYEDLKGSLHEILRKNGAAIHAWTSVLEVCMSNQRRRPTCRSPSGNLCFFSTGATSIRKRSPSMSARTLSSRIGLNTRSIAPFQRPDDPSTQRKTARRKKNARTGHSRVRGRGRAVFRRRAKKGAPSERKGLPLIRGKNQAFAFWVRTRRISSVKRGTILQTSPTTP